MRQGRGARAWVKNKAIDCRRQAAGISRRRYSVVLLSDPLFSHRGLPPFSTIAVRQPKTEGL
jgi:hypothetical protein